MCFSLCHFLFTFWTVQNTTKLSFHLKSLDAGGPHCTGCTWPPCWTLSSLVSRPRPSELSTLNLFLNFSGRCNSFHFITRQRSSNSGTFQVFFTCHAHCDVISYQTQPVSWDTAAASAPCWCQHRRTCALRGSAVTSLGLTSAPFVTSPRGFSKYLQHLHLKRRALGKAEEDERNGQVQHPWMSFRCAVLVWRMNRGQPSSPETLPFRRCCRAAAAALNWVVVKGDALGEMRSNTTRSRRRAPSCRESQSFSRHDRRLQHLALVDIKCFYYYPWI